MTSSSEPTLKSQATTTLIVASVFIYFLIFAQFGFLHRLSESTPSTHLIEIALFGIGLGGICGCILAVRCFTYQHAKSWLMAGFITCGLSATAIAAVPNIWIAIPLAFCVGLFLGNLTVIMVPVISRTIAPEKIGFWISLGVGGAYATCNIPLIFNSTAQDHCIIGGAACVLGVVLSNYLPSIEKPLADIETTNYRTPRVHFSKAGLVAMVACFLALIWLDSAAFFIIQETEGLKSHTWSSDRQLWMLASIHFAAALMGGWLLDRGWLQYLLLIALAVLMLGGWGIDHPPNTDSHWPVFAYVIGVSLYSTALVAYAALRPDSSNTPKIQTRAAWVFAVAGWFGSAMGIGMAKDLHTIPLGFFVVATIVAGISFIVSKKAEVKEPTYLNPLPLE